MPRPKLNIETVKERFASAGYAVIGEYRRKDIPILARCDLHTFEGLVIPNNIFQGGQMQCCGKASMAAKLSIRMTSEGNHFYGKKHGIETREKISRYRQANPPAHRPPTPAHKAAGERLRGIPRSEETKSKIRSRILARYSVFGYSVRMAASGKTAGKQGIFYVVRIGSLLKFGSATTTMCYRLNKLRAKHGEVELIAHVLVDDAGAYEAMAMERCKEHWHHGEYFNDWLSGAST